MATQQCCRNCTSRLHILGVCGNRTARCGSQGDVEPGNLWYGPGTCGSDLL